MLSPSGTKKAHDLRDRGLVIAMLYTHLRHAHVSLGKGFLKYERDSKHNSPATKCTALYVFVKPIPAFFQDIFDGI
jgi:hypothetical protein